jgi:hypothetical protein
MFVPGGEELVDRGLQIVDIEERATPDSLVGQLGEPAFNKVKPTATGGHIVDHETGMLAEPCLHLRGTVSAVIIDHQVQGYFARKLAVDATQEFQELLMPVPLMAVSDDFTLQ